MIKYSIRVTLLWLAFTCAALAADAIQGETLYRSKCLRCHRTDQTRLKTPPPKIPELLQSGRVSTHRFILSDSELDNLAEYLESREPPR